MPGNPAARTRCSGGNEVAASATGGATASAQASEEAVARNRGEDGEGVRGGAAPVVMNGANEELVALFLSGRIGFLDIPETIEKVMETSQFAAPRSVDDILQIDRETRRMTREMIGQ